ncbi:hypothetical protein QUF50_03480 [Thiotrichales bacterium HSG1]|nr:hypothetical protein [Thiotrichales bacterium HSG1]
MKYFRYIIIILIFSNYANAQDYTVNFNHSHIFGIGVNRIQFDNIILETPVQTYDNHSLDSIVYEETVYNIPFKICRYNSGSLYMLPKLGIEESNCKIAEELDLSNSHGTSITSDRVQINNVFYNEIAYDIIFKFNHAKLQFEQDDGIVLLPNVMPDYIRITLDWGEELSELDAHLTGPIFSYSAEHFHLYFDDINNDGDVATLNIGYGEFETRPEVVTILPPIVNFDTKDRGVALRPGSYRFTVQHFYGSGTLLESDATVRLQIENEPNEQLFALPNCEGVELLGEMDIWIVFALEILEDGTVITNPIQRCESGISPHEIR